MTRFQWGALIWLGVFLPVFLTLELLGEFRAVPWPTLSEFTWDSIQWWHIVGAIVAAFLFVLLGHFEWRWPARALIITAVIGAAVIAVHLIIKELR